MKKVVLFSGVMVLLASVALAGPPKKGGDKKADKTPTTIKCAVMSSSDVNVKEATEKKMYADYKGNRYFFCCAGCPDAFKKEPAKFAKAPHIATPKKGKKA
jgi:YHS domain-containing protein